jgi:hypothetical protein
MQLGGMSPRSALFAFGSLILTATALAWDYEGHRIVNQVALASLPADFPAFVRTPAAAERIAWLCSEPDRWRSSPDLPIRHSNGMDHYLDLEQLEEAGLSAATVSSFRFEFAAQFAAGRAAHPENFPAVEPEQNTDHSREWPGFLPWAITEYYGKLRADFARLKVLRELGTPDEVTQTEASIVEVMGVMGHFVGDTAQPLHTTKHHNGWVGPNPGGYTTWKGFHSWIDSGFILKAGITFANVSARVTPATPLAQNNFAGGRDPMFNVVMDYVLAQHQLMEKTYQLEKAGKLNHDKNPAAPEGIAFLEDRLLTGGEMLGRLWLTAWQATPPDAYLRAQLLRKQAGGR